MVNAGLASAANLLSFYGSFRTGHSSKIWWCQVHPALTVPLTDLGLRFDAGADQHSRSGVNKARTRSEKVDARVIVPLIAK